MAGSPKIETAWRVFQSRRLFLMSPMVGVSLMPGRGYRRPDVDRALASILYINAASILDQGAKRILEERGLTDPGGLGDRLKRLNEHELLLDYEGLKAIKDRRNVFAHEEGNATSPELIKACDAIQRQLVEWKLINDEPMPEPSFGMTPITS